jgi:hypothetical protein
MTSYSINTLWSLDAPIGDVFDLLREPESWLFVSDEVAVIRTYPGDEDGRYGAVEVRMPAPLVGTLQTDVEIIEAIRPSLATWRLRGDLEGLGRWHLDEMGGLTDVGLELRATLRRGGGSLLVPGVRKSVDRAVGAWVCTAAARLADRLDAPSPRVRGRLGRRPFAGDRPAPPPLVSGGAP